MKAADIGGFIAIFAAGTIAGKDHVQGSWPTTDLLIMVGLLIVGFYLAVILS